MQLKNSKKLEIEAIEKANNIDLILSNAIRENELDTIKEELTWNLILKRNGIEPPKSQFDLSIFDHFIYSITGLIGGIIDLTKNISDSLNNETIHNSFDKQSKKYIKQITGQDGIAAIDNKLGGDTHRLIGPSHDLARFSEAVNQIMKGKFHSNVHGVGKILDRYSKNSSKYLKIKDPIDAAFVLFLHIIGDFFFLSEVYQSPDAQTSQSQKILKK